MGDIAHQFGFAEETTYATAVTPDRFLEFTGETLERRQNVVQSEGIRSGRRYGGQGRAITREGAGGNVNFEVATRGFGLFFEHLLGAVASTQPDPVNDPNTWEHLFTPGELLGKSLTLQKGVEKPDGTVQAFTYPGSKIVSVTFSNGQDGLLLAQFTYDAQQEETATALATQVITPPTVFTYAQGTVEVDDVVKGNVRSVGGLTVTNNLDTDRFFLGNAGLKSEPINTPMDTLSGTLDVEFQNLTDFYDLFAADTPAKLELFYVGDVIDTNFNFEIHITIADARFTGETPKMGGPELVFQNVPWVGLDPATGNAIEILYRTDDTAP